MKWITVGKSLYREQERSCERSHPKQQFHEFQCLISSNQKNIWLRTRKSNDGLYEVHLRSFNMGNVYIERSIAEQMQCRYT